MKTSQKYFLELLKDYLHGRNSIDVDKQDIPDIVKYAKMHQVEAIVYKQAHIHQLTEAYFLTLYQYAHRCEVIKQIESHFEDIDYLFVKGHKVAACYPTPAFRTMGDIDLVVHSDDRIIAHKLMLEMGFENLGQGNNEWKYRKANTCIELHDELVTSDNNLPINTGCFFNNCWEYLNNGHLNWNFHYLFLIMHLRNHLVKTGVGFRQFFDLAIVSKYKKLDWSWIERKLEELDLLSFFKTVVFFINKWFEAEIPVEPNNVDKHFFDYATACIFENGVFGFNNQNNDNNSSINSYWKFGKKGIGYTFIKDLFLPYNRMLCMKEYQFIKGRKYLIPVAWIYRIRNKWKNRTHILKKYTVSKDDISEREYYLKNWNLRE